MLRWLVIALVALTTANCQTSTQTAAPPDARKYEHPDAPKASRTDTTRSDGRWYLQRPSSY